MTQGTGADTRPFLRRPVKLPYFMAAVPFLILVMEFVDIAMRRGVVTAVVVMAGAALLTGVLFLLKPNWLFPIPPLPKGYVVPMWMVVIAYPVYALFFLTFVLQIFL